MSSQDPSKLPWTAIVVTCTSEQLREGIEEECRRLSDGGLLPDHELLLVVADPKQPGNPQAGKPDSGVGSGGATINAVFVAIERMSAQLQLTTINNELVNRSRILVVHLGRTLAHFPGGAAFLRIGPQLTCVPTHIQTTPPTLLQHTIWAATKLGEKTATGVWVTSLDTFLPFTSAMNYTIPNPETGLDALVCTVQTPMDVAAHHGVVLSDQDNHVNNMVFRMPVEEMKKNFKDGNASVLSGAVYLSPPLTETLLGLHVLSPLDRCTYYGMDSGVPSLQISLYFDLLLPLCCDVGHDEYVSGKYGASYALAASYSTVPQQELRSARLQIWKQIRGFKALVWPLGEVNHHYLGMNMAYKDSVLSLLPSSGIQYLDKWETDARNIVSVNALIEGNVATSGEKVYIFDSWIGRDTSLNFSGPSVFNGIQMRNSATFLKIPGECVWQQYTVGLLDVVTCHGLSDNLAQDHEEPTSTIFNTSWYVFIAKTGIKKEDLWDTATEVQNLLSAKIFLPGLPIEEQLSILSALVGATHGDNREKEWKKYMLKWRSYPRVSLAEAMFNCDVKKIIQTQESLFLESFKQYLIRTADDLRGMCLVPIFEYFVKRGIQPVKEVLHVLHMCLQAHRPSTSRLFLNIADLLGCLAHGNGGLRSGPAGNPHWRNALLDLKKGNRLRAIQQMQEVCEEWIDSEKPEYLIRAARHYERASQIFACQQVETGMIHTTTMWVSPELRRGVGVGVWVEARSPARLDLAGGWTDTAPMCYEHGGALFNVAIKVNKEKPIQARTRFIPELQVVCVLRDCSGAEMRLTWTKMDDLRDYDNPFSPGALVKTVLLYTRLLDLNNPDSLAAQLKEKNGCGVEVDIWSKLPKGSGLGGSSIIAGTLLGALMVLLGHPPPTPAHLIHAILTTEQWLTAGGGWQDPVGGLVGGAKLGYCSKGTPMTVIPYQVPIPDKLLELFNRQFLLIYSGKVRLARNMLQIVVRNWYACDPTLTKCFSELRLLALKAAGYTLDNNLEGIGYCLFNNWRLKKIVGPGSEPNEVTKLMASIQEYCYGMALGGAGGGGYFYALCKNDAEPVSKLECLKGMTCDDVEVDHQGLEIWIGDEHVLEKTVSNEILTHDKLKKFMLE